MTDQSNPTIAPGLAEFIRTVVTEVLHAARYHDVRTARVRFTSDHCQFNNFEWIMCDHLAAVTDEDGSRPERIWAHTNDFDFMAGSPLAFDQVRPVETADEIIDLACAFLNERFARATRLEIRLETDPTDHRRRDLASSADPEVARANAMFQPFVGDSDAGFANIRPWQSPMHDLP